MNLPNKKLTVIGILIILILIIALIIPLVLLKSGKSKDDYNAAGRKELISINNVINATENHVNGLIEKATTEKKKKSKRSVDYGIIKNEVRTLQKSLQDLDRALSSTSFQSAVGECKKILTNVKLVLDNIKQNQFNITHKFDDELSQLESQLKECDTTLETIKTIGLDDVEVAKELVNNIDRVMKLSQEIIKETPKQLQNTPLVENPKNYTVSNNETTPSVLINPEINDTKSKNKTNNDTTPANAITSETSDKKPKNETNKDSSSVVIKPEIEDNKSNNKTNEVIVPAVEAKTANGDKKNSEEKANSLIKSGNKTEVKQEQTSGVTIKIEPKDRNSEDKAEKDEALVTVTTPKISEKKDESEREKNKAIIDNSDTIHSTQPIMEAVTTSKTVTRTSKVTIEPKIETVETTTKPQTKTSKTTTKEVVMTTKTTIEQNIIATVTTTKPIMKTTIGTTSTEDKLKETGEAEGRKATIDKIVKQPEDKAEKNRIKELMSPPVMKQIDHESEENKIEEIVSPPLVKQFENKEEKEEWNVLTKIEMRSKLEKGQTEKGKLEPNLSENDLEKTAEVLWKSSRDEELKGN